MITNPSEVFDTDLFSTKTNIEHIIAAALDTNTKLRIPKLWLSYSQGIIKNSENYISTITEMLGTNSTPRIFCPLTVNSRGYAKIDEMITKKLLTVKGNVLDLTAGAGGMAQRFVQEPYVQNVFGNTFIEKETKRKRICDFKTMGASKFK